jgi:hypothetical protein
MHIKLLTIVLALAGFAHASLLNGTFGFVPTLGASFTGSSLGGASSVTVTALESINTLPLLYLGHPNDFLGAGLAIGDTATIAAADVSLAVAHLNAGSFPLALPGYLGWAPATRFTFDVASISWSSSAATNLSFIATGTLIDHTGFFSATPADISGSFTTTGAGSAVNASFTLATEDVPERASILLVLTGLLVLMCARRMRAA